METKSVVFWKDKDGNIFAVFTEEPYNLKLYGYSVLSCYEHTGQHGSCHIDFLSTCEQAKADEYEFLKLELEDVGYNLHILNK